MRMQVWPPILRCTEVCVDTGQVIYHGVEIDANVRCKVYMWNVQAVGRYGASYMYVAHAKALELCRHDRCTMCVMCMYVVCSVGYDRYHRYVGCMCQLVS